MPGALNEEKKRRVDGLRESAGRRSEIGPDEMAALRTVVAEQMAARMADMRGDLEAIEAHCLERTLEHLDLAAICPKWHSSIMAEHRAMQALREEARTGLAYAHAMMRDATLARPEMESLTTLVRHHVQSVRGRLRGDDG